MMALRSGRLSRSKLALLVFAACGVFVCVFLCSLIALRLLLAGSVVVERIADSFDTGYLGFSVLFVILTFVL